MIQQAIKQLVEGQNLTTETAEQVMNQIMSGEATDAQIAAFLVALRMKGETVEEITGCVKIMRDKAAKINPQSEMLVDTCGTGGDKLNTFNISTIAALVVAGAGVPVAKHGNRAVSSRCGSADLLEALGVNINLEPEQVKECIDKVGIGFLFAPNFHVSMKHVASVRKELGIRTIFNILGPLTNPAGAKFQVLGVFDKELTEKLAKVLASLGSEHVLVVHGLDGLDEISLIGETQISEFKKGSTGARFDSIESRRALAPVETYTIRPEDFGFRRVKLEDIKADSVEDNVKYAQEILNGQKGLAREAVVLNAGAAIYVSGKSPEIKECIKLAEESIDQGKAKEKLEELKEFSNKIKS